LINFWNYSNYKRIHSKLFLRSDLYKKIRGLNNSQELVNKSISIEWTKEEIFNYFFNLVKLYVKEDFISAIKSFDFKSLSNDDLGWRDKFINDFNNIKQINQDEYVLRRLCWVFFGQYPDYNIFALEMKTQKQHISLNLYRSAIDFPMENDGRCMCFYEE
jgi:hypothetical protein